MLGYAFIIVGAAGMLLGALMLCQWIGSAQRWTKLPVYESTGDTKNQRQYIDLYFIATVVAPLLIGATLILFGLRRVL